MFSKSLRELSFGYIFKITSFIHSCTDSNYVDAGKVALPMLDKLGDIINSKQLNANFNANLQIGSSQYIIKGNVNISNGIQVTADLYYQNVKVIAVDLRLLNGKLYLKANNIPWRLMCLI